MAAISLKLLVDKKKNRVVFAESNKDFVDILFGFLTMPVGTVVRVLGKKSSLGCMDKLYESVESLSTKNMETKSSKTMLLRPRSAADPFCEELIVDDVDGTNTWKLYYCVICYWFTESGTSEPIITHPNCRCGDPMNTCFRWPSEHEGGKGDIFPRGESKYVISDDLHVAHASIASTHHLLHDLGIKDSRTLETRFVHVSKAEVLALLKGSLLSGTPLTDVFLRNMFSIEKHKPTRFFEPVAQIEQEGEKKHEPIRPVEPAAHINQEDENEAPDQWKMITVKLLQNKITNEVVYAEAGHDFVDVLFSFLTLPLGSIVKLLNRRSSIRCIDNLYKSAEEISDGTDGIKAEETINMLTARYVKRTTRFMVTNEMVVSPFSPISGVDMIKALKMPISIFVEREVSFGEAEVLNLMKACLI